MGITGIAVCLLGGWWWLCWFVGVWALSRDNPDSLILPPSQPISREWSTAGLSAAALIKQQLMDWPAAWTEGYRDNKTQGKFHYYHCSFFHYQFIIEQWWIDYPSGYTRLWWYMKLLTWICWTVLEPLALNQDKNLNFKLKPCDNVSHASRYCTMLCNADMIICNFQSNKDQFGFQEDNWVIFHGKTY